MHPKSSVLGDAEGTSTQSAESGQTSVDAVHGTAQIPSRFRPPDRMQTEGAGQVWASPEQDCVPAHAGSTTAKHAWTMVAGST